MKLTFHNTIIALASALLVFLIFSYSLEFVAFDRKFYDEQYQKNNLYTHFSQNDVKKATDDLLTYLRYEEGNKPIESSFFNVKEKQHLIDVKNILQKERSYNSILTILFIITIGILSFAGNLRMTHGKLGVITGSVGLGILLLLGLLISIDFSLFWTNFHLVAFTNDLWLLNPATDNLIVLYPEPFWMAIVTRLLSYMAVSYLLILLGGIFLSRSKVLTAH